VVVALTSFFSKTLSATIANAGLVITIPMKTPIKVVTAKPFIAPTPINIIGITDAIMVDAALKTKKKALFTLCFVL
jgi:hypothetical protein